MSSYPLLNAFLTMFWLFIWILWIFLVVRIILDIFRSHDLGGWAKAGWLVFVILLPFLGVFVYLIARGHHMTAQVGRPAQEQERESRSSARDAADGSGQADQLSKLADLRDRGVITDAEFQQGKAKILS
jgi:putative oligomerization/nucleic acid binding protein/phospholipase D-like protein